MAKKKTHRPNTEVKAPEVAANARPVAPGKTTALTAANAGKMGAKQQALIIAGIAVITWLCLKISLNNKFTNWDDDNYISGNALVRDISASGLAHLFSTTTSVMGNYHPLTILSYALEYSKVGLDPFLYHFDSLLLHVINTALVYVFIYLLTRKPVAAALTALLFGIHPMHVESVAWMAGRKDVLYGLFYLACCVTHILFIRAEKNKKYAWYLLGLLLFICSLLSKPVAVVLPLSLLLIDYYEKRKAGNVLPLLIPISQNKTMLSLEKKYFDLSWFIEKIPHFVISVIFGAISIRNQRDFHALFRSTIDYGFIGRILLGCYSLVTYLWKALLPIDLCCFYPYPSRIDGSLPTVYFIYPLIVVGIIFVCWRFLRTNRAVLFGSLFFLVNIVLLLQFIPVGGAIFAERYSYIPYIGLFFIAGIFTSGLLEQGNRKQLGYLALGGLGLWAAYLGFQSNERCKVWHDSGSLWRDEIEKQPFRTANSYNNLALYYYNKFSDAKDINEKKLCHDSAAYLLHVTIQIESDFANPYIGLGVLEQEAGKPEEAKQYLLKALSFKEERFYFTAYQKLAIIYAMQNKYDSAVYYFDAALKVNNNAAEVHTNYGKLLRIMGKPDAALKEFVVAIAKEPGYFAPYLERGVLLLQANKLPDAMADLNHALQLNTQSGESYYYRAMCYKQMGNEAAAQADMQKAKSFGFGN